jgi:small GTP-binding protein
VFDNPDTVELPPAFKIVICGSTGVGKTCLVHRYAHETILRSTKSTLGVDFSLKHVVLDRAIMGREDFDQRKDVLQLWDFAGEDRFRKILPVYARGAQGVLLCFDLGNRPTLDDLAEWHVARGHHRLSRPGSAPYPSRA